MPLDGNSDGFGGDDFIDQHYVAIPGDANLDGRVDVLGDAFALVANLGSTTNLAFTDGNFNGDGVVDVLGDAFILVANLGQDVTPPTSITVTNATDVTNADTSSIAALIANDGGDGISLREAVVATNNTPGDDTITFDSGVFSGGANSLIRLTQGELSIDESLTIDASAGTDITISADANGDDATVSGTLITDIQASFGGTAGASDDLLDDNSRVIRFASTADADVLTLTNLTITGGRTTESLNHGGGLYSLAGSISLLDSTVRGNSTTGPGAGGGGLYSRSGDISLTNSTVSGNSTSGFASVSPTGAYYYSGGGGIGSRDGSISLTDSTVSGNSAAGRGGGLFLYANLRGISLTNSTVSGNSGGEFFSSGGGIYSPASDISLTNSTVSGNSGSIGGISTLFGAVSVTNSTITENSGPGIIGSFSGNFSGDLTIYNSIVAGNQGNDVSMFDDPGSNLTVEHSLIGNTTGSFIDSSTGTGNILNQPALLGPLSDNGGPTLTHALLSGSPAIDAGDNALAVDADGVPIGTDQRGSGFNRISGSSVDIGAFELQTLAPTVLSATIDEGGVLARPDLLNTLTVVFDSDVTVTAGDLSLVNDSLGGVATDLTGIGLSYDSTNNTAVWDFSTLDPLEAAFYTWQLDAEAITSEGLALDGNGDGTGGDDLTSQHYVAIPGDANLDGVVDVLDDAFALVGNLGSVTNVAWADGNFDDNDAVDVLGDAFILVGNLGRDVRPPVSAGALAPSKLAVSYSGSSEVTPTPVLIAGDPEDDLDESSLRTTSNAMESRAPELALAGTHNLRDDVFGSDF